MRKAENLAALCGRARFVLFIVVQDLSSLCVRNPTSGQTPLPNRDMSYHMTGLM